MDLEENKKTTKNRGYGDSFKYAFFGIKTAFQEERNMRTHLILGLVTVLCCLFLNLSLYEWFWILLCIFQVLVTEIWNTVIENVVDLVTGQRFHQLAKKAKDMAAAAVLLTSLFSTIVGAVIIFPKVFHLFF
ncbi:diacylglycerol kinase family protein [Pisciglobus halotolerans]|uniref:diacylglycerol kinase family protein n=1 Tax=Pisciglobus halotolerans TaxID=745365 RepID=UPI000B82A897|nr:diacylglycerol kinase family protein [Pisciglobus halotolerans]